MISGSFPAGLFADALTEGDMQVVGEIQAWSFLGSFKGGPKAPRLALGVQTWENESPDVIHRHALVLTETMLVKLIVACQMQLQKIQAEGPPGDGDEPG
jgi:hypothetical protein